MERPHTLTPPDGRNTKRYPNGYPRLDTIRGPWWWFCAAGDANHSHFAIARCHNSQARIAVPDFVGPCCSPEECGWEYRPDLT